MVSDYKLDNAIKYGTQVELATMTASIVLFALWVGFLTTASRKEVFSVVAAYAAVLVVIVRGSGGSPTTTTPTTTPR